MSEFTPIRLPESTAAYLTDSAIHGAIESVLTVGGDTLPKGLNLRDLDAYYRARAAAVSAKYDTIIAMNNLWKAVWGSLVEGWKVKDLRDLGPNECWDGLEFWHHHQRNGFDFYSAVTLRRAESGQPATMNLYCSLSKENDDGELLRDPDISCWAPVEKGDWSDWMVLSIAIHIPENAEIDPSAWSVQVDEVRAAVRKFT